LTASDFQSEPAHVVAQSSSSCTAPQVLLRVLPVQLKGPNGEITTYALFDEGSTVTLMDHNLANSLGLHGQQDLLQLRWTENSCQLEADSMRVAAEIRGHDDPKTYRIENIRTVKNLSLSVHSVDYNRFKTRRSHLKTMQLKSLMNVQPKLLIGQDNCQLIIR